MWLEIITIRVQSESKAPLVQTLLENRTRILAEIDNPMTLFSRLPWSLDVAIHLHHRDEENPQPSALGLQLADALGEFGTVDHAVWRSLNTTILD